MHPPVHGGVIQTSEDMRATYMSIIYDGINNLWHILTMKFYSAILKTEILPFSTT